ncbi:DEAD/DEAH box helicase [Streptosporangium lutulentum]
MDALRRAEQLTASDLRPPADPAEWNESDVELVHVLFMFSQALSLSKSPQWSDLQSLTEDLRSVKQSARLQSWLFGGDRRKQQIRDIYQTTRQRALSSLIVNATETMAHKIKDTRQADDRLRNSAELITVWRNSSATLLSLLEQFTAEEGSPQEKAAVLRGVGRSFLPMDLAERIQAQSLDLQLVMKTIRPYQQFGAKFALTVRQALLGDKMGLGKTIEALAAIAHAITHEKQFHHLVICPASLIENWLQEIIETLPTIPGLAFREPDAERTFQRWQRDGGIILVSFQQAAKLAEKDLPSIGFVIVDEAHYVKNPDANRTRATATLVRLGQRALLMGGTPMENRAAEFINLVDLVSSSEGKKLKQRFGDGRRAHLDGDRFRREIAHLYLRRNQKDVLDELPPLIAQDEVIQVGSAERSAYQSALLEGNLMAARALLSSANDTDSAKMERLSQISEECRRNERKLLVFSYFRDVLTTARKVIGEECGEISGGVTIVDRHRLVTEFNARAASLPSSCRSTSGVPD